MNQFLKATIDKVEDLMQQTYVSSDIKLVLQDLLIVTKNMEVLKNENTGINADNRYKEKKAEAERLEKRRLEKELEALKKAIGQDVPPIIKNLSGEVQQILLQGQLAGNQQAVQAAERMKAQLRELIEVIATSAQPANPSVGKPVKAVGR